jgi:hypothetical protein
MEIMSRSAKTMIVVGIYVLILGILMILVPNFLLRMFMQPETSEIWIRTTGMFLLFLGYYYIAAARAELTQFFQFSVYARACVILFFIGFVIFLSASPVLIAFGIVDLGTAIWTQIALLKDRSEGVS